MADRGETLPRAHILRNRLLLNRIRREGQRVGDRFFLLSVALGDESEPTQAAFLTPKRLGHAVVRNRLRRRMREVHRRYVDWPQRGLIFIWSAKPPAVTLTFDELKSCLLKLAQRHERKFRSQA